MERQAVSDIPPRRVEVQAGDFSGNRTKARQVAYAAVGQHDVEPLVRLEEDNGGRSHGGDAPAGMNQDRHAVLGGNGSHPGDAGIGHGERLCSGVELDAAMPLVEAPLHLSDGAIVVGVNATERYQAACAGLGLRQNPIVGLDIAAGVGVGGDDGTGVPGGAECPQERIVVEHEPIRVVLPRVAVGIPYLEIYRGSRHRSFMPRREYLLGGHGVEANRRRSSVELCGDRHIDSRDAHRRRGFLYGTIITDGVTGATSTNVCVFADAQIDRSPTGSDVQARLAAEFERETVQLEELRRFRSIVGSEFTGRVIDTTAVGDATAVIVEVGGRVFYTGESRFAIENDDDLGGFVVS